MRAEGATARWLAARAAARSRCELGRQRDHAGPLTLPPVLLAAARHLRPGQRGQRRGKRRERRGRGEQAAVRRKRRERQAAVRGVDRHERAPRRRAQTGGRGRAHDEALHGGCAQGRVGSAQRGMVQGPGPAASSRQCWSGRSGAPGVRG